LTIVYQPGVSSVNPVEFFLMLLKIFSSMVMVAIENQISLATPFKDNLLLQIMWFWSPTDNTDKNHIVELKN